MGKPKDPNRDKAKKLYRERDGDITNREIGRLLGIDERKVAVWKKRDNWDSGDVVQRKKSVVQQRKVIKRLAEAVDENEELNEREKLFCLYYVRIFNAKLSAIRAGYSENGAKQCGFRLLQRQRVQDEIRRLKKLRVSMELLADPEDIVNLYMRIAFADMTDAVEFGTEERTVVGEMGEVKTTDPETGEIKPLTYMANYVRLKNSDDVDGQLITEVKQGRDGISVKRADSMRALEWLSKYFEIFPGDRRKADFEERRVKVLEREKEEESGSTVLAQDWVTALMEEDDGKQS